MPFHLGRTAFDWVLIDLTFIKLEEIHFNIYKNELFISLIKAKVKKLKLRSKVIGEWD